MGQENEPIVVNEENEVTEIDKNRINAKFEFYTGKEKNTEEVIQLLDEAKNSLKGAQVSYSNEGNTESEKELQSIKLTIEDGVKNVELAENIKTMLQTNKTYTVTTEKDSNNVVTTILISINQ